MSHNIPSTLAVKACQEAAKAKLIAQNKEHARVHLLQIQLLLARQALPRSK